VQFPLQEFIESGKLPLSDEELENVAGGGLIDNVKKGGNKSSENYSRVIMKGRNRQ